MGNAFITRRGFGSSSFSDPQISPISLKNPVLRNTETSLPALENIQTGDFLRYKYGVDYELSIDNRHLAPYHFAQMVKLDEKYCVIVSSFAVENIYTLQATLVNVRESRAPFVEKIIPPDGVSWESSGNTAKIQYIFYEQGFHYVLITCLATNSGRDYYRYGIMYKVSTEEETMNMIGISELSFYQTSSIIDTYSTVFVPALGTFYNEEALTNNYQVSGTVHTFDNTFWGDSIANVVETVASEAQGDRLLPCLIYCGQGKKMYHYGYDIVALDTKVLVRSVIFNTIGNVRARPAPISTYGEVSIDLIDPVSIVPPRLIHNENILFLVKCNNGTLNISSFITTLEDDFRNNSLQIATESYTIVDGATYGTIVGTLSVAWQPNMKKNNLFVSVIRFVNTQYFAETYSVNVSLTDGRVLSSSLIISTAIGERYPEEQIKSIDSYFNDDGTFVRAISLELLVLETWAPNEISVEKTTDQTFNAIANSTANAGESVDIITL